MTFILILDEYNKPTLGENDTVLIHDTSNGTLFFVSRDAVEFPSEQPAEAVALPSEEPVECDQQNDSELQQQESGYSRTNWSRPQILQLIESYKKHRLQFDNSTIRHVMVWKRIAADIGHHTGQEAMNKFKYLKTRYTKKEDNMSPRSSGDKALHFDFFEEFDEIFGRDPNIIPLSIASSSRSNNEDLINEDSINEDSINEVNRQSSLSPASSPLTRNNGSRKRKKENALLEFLKQKEEARERRHKESINAIQK